MLEADGLDLATARAELLRVGPTIEHAADPASALRAIGVDVRRCTWSPTGLATIPTALRSSGC